MTALPAVLMALVLALAPLAATAQQSTVDTTEAPNWPTGVESWQSDQRAPKSGDPDAAERLGLTDPDVKRSLMPPPTEQGTRPPASTEETSGGGGSAWSPLYAALNRARTAPAALDGQPLRRPNPLASEPTTEMQPVGGPASLFPEGYVE